MENWWGNIEFAINDIKLWQIGERYVAVQRKENEWLFWNAETKNETSDRLTLHSVQPLDINNSTPTQRFLVHTTKSTLSVKPALADRSMVIRPSSTLSLLPNERTQLYVSTQLWLTFSIENNTSPLFETPIWKPSDSWFGESNMSGEVCYAKYSEANVRLDSLKKRSHRVFTKINIINEHKQMLTIQRIKIPLPLLALYIDKENRFWTDSIHLIHNENNNKPSFAIHRNEEASSDHHYVHMSDARQRIDSNMFMRSIKSLIA